MQIKEFYIFRNIRPVGSKIITISEKKPKVFVDQNGDIFDWLPQGYTASITNQIVDDVFPDVLPGECMKVKFHVETFETDFAKVPFPFSFNEVKDDTEV